MGRLNFDSRRKEEKNFFEGSVQLEALPAALNKIYKAIQADGLSEENSLNLQADIDSVAKFFGISPKGAILLSAIAESNLNGGCDMVDLTNFIGCSNIEFIGFKDALVDIESKGVIEANRGRGRRTTYILSREAVVSISNGSEFKPADWSGINIDAFFTRLRAIFSDYHKDAIDEVKLLQRIQAMVDANPQLEFCRKLIEGGLDGCADTEKRMFFYLCHRLVSWGEENEPLERLLGLAEYDEDVQLIRRYFSNEDTRLQELGLVVFGGKGGFRDPEWVTLSENAIKEYLGEVKLMRKANQQERYLMKAESIVAKDLWYNPAEQEQMDRLSELLDGEKFKGVQTRLGEMGMRKGFAVLFAGGAGTGKTAGVYELARRSGRDIFVVDMSQLKSKWVGDSEKIVKGLFDSYKEMCDNSEKAPILLFNEADAIFSKRIQNPDDSVDQMMNAIQNICLDAIENLDGILIATTNLAENFCDEAFARRFIFKINFTTPEAGVRAKIWKSMIPSLSEEDAAELGERFKFAGGNIENIARKAAVGYVLSGRKADLDELVKYGNEEMLSSKGNVSRIGF